MPIGTGGAILGSAAISGGSQLLGGLFAGLFGGDGPAQIDPEIQALLQSRGLDIGEFQANLAAAQLGLKLPFAQAMQQYPIELQQQLQDTYTQTWGGVERAGAKMAEMAMKGEVSPAMQNFITNYKQTSGRAMQTSMEQSKMMAGAAGQDLSSPAVQSMLAEQDRLGRLGIEGQAAQMGAEDVARSGQQAMNMLRWASESKRLAGAQMPQAPQTAEQRRNAPIQAEITRLQELLGKVPAGEQAYRTYISNQIKEMQGQLTEPLVPTGVPHATNMPIPTYEPGGAAASGYSWGPGQSAFQGGQGGGNYYGAAAYAPQQGGQQGGSSVANLLNMPVNQVPQFRSKSGTLGQHFGDKPAGWWLQQGYGTQWGYDKNRVKYDPTSKKYTYV